MCRTAKLLSLARNAFASGLQDELPFHNATSTPAIFLFCPSFPLGYGDWRRGLMMSLKSRHTVALPKRKYLRMMGIPPLLGGRY